MGGFFGGGGASVADMVGATSSAAGTAGLVPAPAAGSQNDILSGDATFIRNVFIRQGTYQLSNRIYLPAINQNINEGNVATGAYLPDDANFMLFFYPTTFEFNRIGIQTQSWPSSQNMTFACYSCDQSMPLFPKTRTFGEETISVASGTTELALSSTWSGRGFFWIAFRFSGTHSTHALHRCEPNTWAYGVFGGLATNTNSPVGSTLGLQGSAKTAFAASYTTSSGFILMRVAGAGPAMSLAKV